MRLGAIALVWATLSIFAGCASVPFGDSDGISPFQTWKQLETDHFWINFSEPASELAPIVATALEEAHSTLSPLLMWEPAKKTQVVLVDNTDAANGLTAPQRTPGIVLFLAMPNPQSAINWNDSWIRTLCFHEYAHFLNMDPTRGIYTPLRWLFGDALLPNAAWYPWMLEGYAVFFETRFHGGRGRSSYWNMVLRSMALEKTLDSDNGVTLDRMMVANPYFPGGETWYLFGYSLVHEFWKKSYTQGIADFQGDLGLGLHSLNSSHRIPYLIDDNAYQSVQMGWTDLWNSWLEGAEKRAEEQLAEIRKSKTTPLQWIVEPAHSESRDVIAPIESPNGKWLAFAADSTRDWQAIWIRDLESPVNAPARLERMDDTLDTTQITWSPDSQWLAYATMNRVRQYSFFYDLYAVRASDRKRIRLTEGERARDPDFSPDGKWLTYVRMPRIGYQELVRAEILHAGDAIQLGEREILHAAPLLHRLASTRFGSSSEQIFFTKHEEGRYSEDLWEWTPNQTRSLLAVDGVFHRFPFFARQGHYAGKLLYQSDASGVDQIYVLGDGRISNFETGARMATPASAALDGSDSALWVSGFSAHGWELARFKALPAHGETPVVRADAPEPAKPVTLTAAAPSVIDDYSGFHSLYPRMWSPQIFFNNVYFTAGIAAYGNDALDFHRYALGLAMDSFSFRPSWAASYANRSIGPTLSLTAADQIVGATSATTSVRNLQFIVSASFPFRWTFSSFTPELAFSAAQLQEYQSGAGAPFGTLIDRGSYIPRLDLNFTYRYTRASTLAVAPETGRISQLSGRIAAVSGTAVPKLYASHTEYFRAGSSHWVFQPKFDTLITPLSATTAGPEAPRVSGFPLAYTGFTSGPYLGPLLGTKNLSQLSLRGYPLILLSSPWIATASLDLRFPIWNIYRGINTLPLTFGRLHGRIFAESAFFPFGDHSPVALPAAGAALELEITLFTAATMNLSVQFQNGFVPTSGGDQLLIFGLTL